MIDQNLIKNYQDKFASNPANAASKYATSTQGLKAASLDPEVSRDHNFVFSNETKRGEITDQKSSGRCWMFAALNTARVSTMEILNVDNFEYSQAYTLFWDKLERSNYFLESIIDTRDEPLDSRIVWHLLQDPVGDGGQWEMFAGILRKYGSVPKSVMPETFNSSNTSGLNDLLANKLREFAYLIREKAQAGASVEELREFKDEKLYFVYNLLVKTLGEPPYEFDYSWRDRDGQFHKITKITPQEFFQKYSGMKTQDMMSFINAPTQDKPYYKTYTVQYLGSIYEEEPVKYLNIPIDVMKEIAINAIKDGHPVWFGCDVGKQSDSKLGIMDKHLYKYEDTIGEGLQLDRAQRLDYSVSLMTHAMVLVGVDLDDEGRPIKWKVENSWGEKTGNKGMFSMSDEWFDEYTYQITVPKQYVSQKLQDDYQTDPIVLKPWDPMGALAKIN